MDIKTSKRKEKALPFILWNRLGLGFSVTVRVRVGFYPYPNPYPY
jgi:hypothetical protein